MLISNHQIMQTITVVRNHFSIFTGELQPGAHVLYQILNTWSTIIERVNYVTFLSDYAILFLLTEITLHIYSPLLPYIRIAAL